MSRQPLQATRFDRLQRQLGDLVLVLLLELLIRLRSRWVNGPVPLPWLMLDNLRLGFVYAVVLEAFKLGS